MKIAFDVHGVLDTHQEFLHMCRMHYENDDTVYIISGQPLDEEMQAFLKKHDIKYHHYFSIETELLKRSIPYNNIYGSKYFPKEHWNPVKAEICERENIDIIFDDTEVYKQHFKNINTVFCLV